MLKVIRGLHYGRPVDSKGFMYLMLRHFNWKVDRHTNPRFLNKHWIKPGNVIRVQDTVMGRPKHNSIYAIKEYDNDDARELISLMNERGCGMKSILSARNPRNPNRALINNTLRQMYNFYINHLDEAKNMSASRVVCSKTSHGTFHFKFVTDPK